MKNKAIIITIIAVCVTFTTVFIFKYIDINTRYPDPVTISQDADGCVSLKEYVVKLNGLQKLSISDMADKYPESEYIREILDKNVSKDETWYLIDLRYTNISENDGDLLWLYYTTLADGYTTNGIDFFAFEDINPHNPECAISLKKDESIEIILPFSIPKGDSSNEKELMLLFSLYPEIICMDLKNM